MKISTESFEPAEWNGHDLVTLLENFSKKRILVVGDVGVDRYTMGNVERISPEAPVPIVRVEDERLKLGLAANVADNIRTLRGNVDLVGVVGRDRCAQDLKQLLKDASISSQSLVVDPGQRTVLKERIVSERQQLLRVDYESLHPVSSAAHHQLVAKIKALMNKVDAVIVEDYAKGLLSRDLFKQVFELAAKAKKVVAVDPNLRTPLKMYKGATVLTPNTREAEALVGMRIRRESDLMDAGQTILKQTGARYVVITRGKDGMAIFEKGKKSVCMIPTYAREVYDVSGAGDTVISVLTLALASGATIRQAAVLGNLAAGVEVGKRGTATETPEEVRGAMDQFLGRI